MQLVGADAEPPFPPHPPNIKTASITTTPVNIRFILMPYAGIGFVAAGNIFVAISIIALLVLLIQREVSTRTLYTARSGREQGVFLDWASPVILTHYCRVNNWQNRKSL